MKDLQEMYDTHEIFRDYVDKYAAKHGISVQTALTHVIVRNVSQTYLDDVPEPATRGRNAPVCDS